jgi:proteasome assembly chaperone (PAC2) family protein
MFTGALVREDVGRIVGAAGLALDLPERQRIPAVQRLKSELRGSIHEVGAGRLRLFLCC